MQIKCLHVHAPYAFIAILVATVVSTASGISRVAQPLERPPALRAKSDQSHERSMSKSWALQTLLEMRVHQPADAKSGEAESKKTKKDAKGKQKTLTDETDEIAAETGKAATEGDDPAAQAEKEALEAVPKTLPPEERVDTGGINKQMKSAAELTGVKRNEHGDFGATLVTLIINALTVVVCALIFSGLRQKFPLIYSGNVILGNVPLEPSKSFWGWVSASLDTTTEMAANHAGLDGAMLLEFFNMCCKLLATIAIPMVIIMCPIHYFFGGGGLDGDKLSSVAMGNVMSHHPWMYYVHAVIVNLVTYTVVWYVYSTMTKFQRLRFDWLKKLPSPRCVTLLVEGIPKEYRSDVKLKEFFSSQFHDGKVHDAVIVKDAKELKRLYDEQTALRQTLSNAKEGWENIGCPEDDRPTHLSWLCVGEKVDTIKDCEEKLQGPDGLDAKVDEARKKALEQAEHVGGINTGSGFVTFTKRRQAVMCSGIVFSERKDEWVVSVPPPASDVLWNDLKQEDDVRTVGNLMAYALVILLYAFFLPLVVVGTNITSVIKMGPYLQPIWASFAPGLALMLLLGFMPTILLIIFRSFMTLRADCFAQHKLQIWYFFFLLFFVILVTTIGVNLVQTFTKVIRRPELGMWLMARNMPESTHFYMDYLMLQWSEQAIHFMRHVQLGKFFFWSRFFEEPAAKDLAEPEDQDYYGIGSRSARFTVILLVGIVFSTLSPLIGLLSLVLFSICRLFYGYLIVFAESKKPDVGGIFFFTMLQHVLFGTGIYNVLMIGVLMTRARTKAPMLIAIPAFVYLCLASKRFADNFVWDELPFKEVDEEQKLVDNGLRYIQPEFIDDTQQAELERTQLAGEASGLVEMDKQSFAEFYKLKGLYQPPGSVSPRPTERSTARDSSRLNSGISDKQKETA